MGPERDVDTNGPVRTRILEAALRLFTERGYASTTMRAIAVEAKVSPSHAYYYFAAKDELVQALYLRIQVEHRDRVNALLAAPGPLAARLHAVVHVGLDVIGPYHDFGTAFVGTAIAPRSAASPFSAESSPAREAALSIFTDLVAGCEPPAPARIRAQLPEVLWLCWMGVVLFWVADDSDAQRRTRELVDAAIPALLAVVTLARLPLTGPLVGHLDRILAVLLPR